MMMVLRYTLYAALLLLFPTVASAERWVEFYSQGWDFRSEKLGKKLNFTSRSYYDADSLKKSSSGDVDVWVREVSQNDKYYVSKGIPSSEVILKKMHLWCGLKKYEILAPEAEDAGVNEAMGEEIKPGSLYEKLFKAVCKGT